MTTSYLKCVCSNFNLVMNIAEPYSMMTKTKRKLVDFDDDIYTFNSSSPLSSPDTSEGEWYVFYIGRIQKIS